MVIKIEVSKNLEKRDILSRSIYSLSIHTKALQKLSFDCTGNAVNFPYLIVALMSYCFDLQILLLCLRESRGGKISKKSLLCEIDIITFWLQNLDCFVLFRI